MAWATCLRSESLVMGFRSITTRLTFSYFFASLLVLVSLSAAVLWAVKHHLYEQDRYNLQQKFNTINELRVRGDFISQYGPFFERGDTKLWLLNGNQVEYQSQSLALPTKFINKASMERIDWQENGHHYRAIRFPLSSSPEWYAVLGLNIDLHITFLSNFKKVLLWITFFASIVSGFLSWFIARKGLKPLAKLEHYVDAISTEELSVRVPQQPFPEELLPLVARFNRMLSRLQGDFERLSEFSSDIAHELRTPIGNMMTQTQVMLAKPRSEQEYRDILESNAEELSRLTKTISDMLYLAKSEHNLLMKNNEPIDLKLLLGDLAEYYELAGDEKSLTITCFGEGQVVGDRNMLKRAFANLLSNAVRHSYPESNITVEIFPHLIGYQIAVTNHGETIESTQIPRLFERFYRADKSRTHQQSGGAGLGLPISRSIAKLHGGDIYAQSKHELTTFTLTLSDVVIRPAH
ncbi:heavy metal sensor histidine kinase [Vibrio vulnificus]|uniref:heavy metal sensor histidine kinase n=1 Tax=Vibrio vulnificus TaxID=672 RepID=UPI000CD29A10|nr:sensor histidine kinase [Vibrio vulnificus]